MADLQKLIEQLTETALHPAKSTAAAIKETGREAVGCFPIYTPEELVYAAGYLPIGLWGGKTELKLADKYLQGFCCTIMRANVEFGLKGTYNMLKACLIPAFCDTLKCIIENWKVACPQVPVIPVVYPQHRGLEVGYTYCIEEFQRVKVELEKLSGQTIREEAVTEAFAIYEAYRQAMREFVTVAARYPRTIDAKTRHLLIKAAYFMEKKTYTELIQTVTTALKAYPEETFAGVKAVATGLLAEPTDLLQILKDSGIAIVADDLAQESRQFRTPARAAGTAWEKMAGRVADQRGCTFLYEEEKTRGQLLIDLVKAQQADAVIVFMMKFCDPEEFDYPVYKKELEAAGIPILYLEIDQQIDSYEQIRTRIQSFAEMLMEERRTTCF